jgi:hypothetical protein
MAGDYHAFISKSSRFNNNLVVALSKDELMRKAFLVFSDSYGEESIEQSNINDKRSHVEALRKYTNLCLEQIRREGEEKKKAVDYEKSGPSREDSVEVKVE